MERREYLLGLLGTAGAVAGGLYLLDQQGGQGSIEPRTVDIVGSDGIETMRVPASEGLTVVDFFSTYCAGCDEQIDALEPVYQTGEKLSVVSLTTQEVGGGFTKSDLRAWWDKHGGPWPVGIDDGSLAKAVDAKQLPTVAILSPDGTVHWVESGASTEAIRNQLESAR